ncbi:MAG: glycosyltransferase family 39 protein [Planctomycetia bacterium]|nr:glycosyltransferase family 39 protein [Planctomycetia bacterium]
MIPLLLQLRTVLAFATIATAAWSVGSIALPYCCVTIASERRGRVVWEAALGLLLWGTFLGLLGLAGMLYENWIVALTLVAATLGVVRMRSELRRFWSEQPVARTLDDTLPLNLRRLVAGCAGIALAASFVAALAPPLAGDALCYHLELPKRFLADNALTYYRDNDNSTFPLLAEMWFLWGLAIDGASGAQLMHWFSGALLAGAAYVLALPLLGRNGSAGAACIVLLTPGINNQMTAPLNDVALSLYTTLALTAWLRAAQDPNRDSLPRKSSLTMLGLMVGGALAVKYTGLVFAGVLATLAFATIARARLSSRPQWIRGTCVAVAAAAVVAGPWYLRAGYHRGDPVFPFLSTHFTEGAPSTFPESKTPLGRGFGALLLAPWSMTMEPERFGGRGQQLGPLFLMLAPCVIVSSRRRELRPLAITAAFYGMGCVLLRQNVRFLFPLVPIFSVIAMAALCEMANWSPLPRRIARSAFVIVLLCLATIPMVRARPLFAVATGMESREAFLARREPTFDSAAWINRNLSSDAHVLSQEQRAFYYYPRWTRENIYRRYTGYNRPTLADATPFEQRLKAAGFTHLFLAENEADDGASSRTIGYDATLSTLADTAMAARPTTGPTTVGEWHSDVDGERRRYRLLLLR